MQAWLDNKEQGEKETEVVQDVAPSATHLTRLITLHKGNVSDVVAQMRSLNKTIQTAMVALRDSAKQAQAWCSGMARTVESDPMMANDQDVRPCVYYKPSHPQCFRRFHPFHSTLNHGGYRPVRMIWSVAFHD
jgi:hypothetical protein